jgi:hypothetical protein
MQDGSLIITNRRQADEWIGTWAEFTQENTEMDPMELGFIQGHLENYITYAESMSGPTVERYGEVVYMPMGSEDWPNIHRVIQLVGSDQFIVEYPVVLADDSIENWGEVGGWPGAPSAEFSTLSEAKGFIRGLELGIKNKHECQGATELIAYIAGFGLGIDL